MTQPGHKQQSSSSAFLQSAAAKILIIGLNAATGILVARALAPAGRGALSAMMLWYAFLANAFTLGIPSALTFHVRKHPEFASQTAGAAILLSLLFSSAAAAIGWIFIPSWIPQYSPETIFFARVFVLNTPIAAFFLVGRAAVESRGVFSASNYSLVIPPTLTLVGLAVLWKTHHFTAVSAAFCYVLAGLPSLFFMIRSVSMALSPQLRDVASSSKRLLSYGIRSYGIDLCGTMALYVDQALVVRILSPNMMGTYVVALSLSRLLNAFHTSVIMVLFPKAVSRPPREVWEMTGRAARMSTCVTALCGAAIVLAGPRLLVTLYGREYRGATTILRILVLEVVLSGATQVLSQAFMALARPGVVTALQGFGLSLTVPLMLLLIPRFGIEGAALSLLLSTTARFCFVLASFPIFLKLPLPPLLLRRADLEYVQSSLAKVTRRFQPKPVGGQVL